MTEVIATARRWGSSIGIIVPSTTVEVLKIKEGEEIAIEIKKRPLAGNLFGKFPRKSKKTPQQIKDEMRTGWE